MESLWRLARTVMALGGVAALLVLAPALNRTALAFEYDVYYVAYYDISSHTMVTEAGYGGSGASGGAGDALVRLVNPEHGDTVQAGTLCAMMYVFDDAEQLQACCGCPVTPDGLRTLSVTQNLTYNFGINKGNLTAGVIKLISAEINWTNAISAGTVPAPPPGVGAITGNLKGCDPSGITDGCVGGRPIGNTGGTTSGLNPTQELRAWLNHTEAMIPSAAPFTAIESTSVTEFAKADLDTTELCNLEVSCGTLVTSGSGAGTCSCGIGDSASTFRPKR